MIDSPEELAPTSLEDVRTAILRQHSQLQQLVDELEAYANQVIAGAEVESRLRDAVRILRTRFLRHLAFEEAKLVPLLRRIPARDSDAAALIVEHSEQREQVDGLLHDVTVFGDPPTFARAALAFVHVLRRDMTAEELWLRGIA